jgi:hypothetical protein
MTQNPITELDYHELQEDGGARSEQDQQQEVPSITATRVRFVELIKSTGKDLRQLRKCGDNRNQVVEESTGAGAQVPL